MQATSLPVGDIDATCLPRDRSALDPDALALLQSSILAEGLRQPIEVFPMQGDQPWGLISGLRRLTVFRTLSGPGFGLTRFAEIPAFIRQPADLPSALAAMVSENEARESISPWEKGALILNCTDAGHFPTFDAAVQGLFPHASRSTQHRLRQFVDVVVDLSGMISTPQDLSVRQMERLALALRAGMSDMIESALQHHAGASLSTQWQALTPIIAEAMQQDSDPPPRLPPRPGRPRRMLQLKQGLLIRREMTKDGWILRFSGPEARPGALMDDVFIVIERMFQKRD